MFKRIKLINQTSYTECGQCCISMIANFYGFRQPISYYKSIYSTGRDGMNVSQVYSILADIHLTPDPYYLNEVSSFDFSNRPYILLTNNNHYIVLKKIADKKFRIWDPAKGVKNVSKERISCINGGIIFEVYPDDDFCCVNNQDNIFKYLINFVKKVKYDLMRVFIISTATYLISAGIPRLLEYIISTLLKENNSTILTHNIFKVVSLSFIYFLFSHFENKMILKLQKNINQEITLETIEHVLNIPYTFFENRGENNIIYRLGLLPKLMDLIANRFVNLLIGTIGIVVLSIYSIIRYNILLPIILVMIIVPTCMILSFNYYIMNKKQDELAREAESEEEQIDLIKNIFYIKTSRIADKVFVRYKKIYGSYLDIFIKNSNSGYFFNLVLTIYSIFSPIFIVLYIGYFYEVTAGEIFFIYSIIGMILTNTISTITILGEMGLLRPTLVYLNDIYDEKKEHKPEGILISEFENFHVKNLSFKYTDSGPDILNNITMKINRGEKISLVGLSGSGKTTLIKLITGIYNTYSGKILINGKNITCVNSHFFENKVAIVSQSTTLFNRTVKENIFVEKNHTDDNTIWKVLKMVNLDDYIKGLPLQLNTMVGEDGLNFSGGQLQRLILARSLIKNPELIILDEATSSLDTYNETLIYNNLKNLGMTILSISHRLDTIKDSDRIYVMDNGKIVAVGNHDSLLESNYMYNQMYNLGG